MAKQNGVKWLVYREEALHVAAVIFLCLKETRVLRQGSKLPVSMCIKQKGKEEWYRLIIY